MTFLYFCTRFPEGLHGVIPYMGGWKEDLVIFLIDADVDGFQQISEAKAFELIDTKDFPELYRVKE